MRASWKSVCMVVAGVVTSALVSAVPAHAQATFGEATGATIQRSDKGWCVPLKVSVAPAQGQPRSWKVSATYCQPFKWSKGAHQVDVLTHGSTYTASYWNWPQNPELYSYTDKTLAAGRATVAYDRIGNGKSTRPLLSTEITMASDAYVLHQLVQGLRLLGYNQVNSISHSYGSGVGLAEAAAYQDVNRIVLTGYLHRASNPAVTAGNYPANQDAKFQGLGLDDGYLTSRPGVRGSSFHSPSSDPAVVAYDELQKDLVSRTGLLDFLGQRGVAAASNVSNKIKVPVLVVNGQQDAIFCYDPANFDCTNAAAVTANEAPFYTAAQSFKVVTVPSSGHDLTLHPSANDSFNTIDQWIKTH
ncbi:MAG TPA: alpha/beta fold hydrolase [Bacillota bacterium]|nr:alpha/beta fold hydrolase [Bacillota bacterium]